MNAYVVIVNYRTSRLVVDCVASLARQREALGTGRVIVVDNASSDGSVPVIRAAIAQHDWHDWVEVIELPRNGGFAYGSNAGIRRVRETDPSFGAVIMLNPDTVVRPGAIGVLLDFLETHGDAGIVGASIEDADGEPRRSAYRDPSALGELVSAAQFRPLDHWYARRMSPVSPDGSCRADWVTGACMALRREALDSVGLMDERFFLYYEEVDFCVRARRLGWQCWFVPQAQVVHFEGASTGIRLPKRPRPAYWYASRRRFFVKHHGIDGLLAADLLWCIGRLSLLLRRNLGLGGRSGIDIEPTRVGFDILAGDWRAFANGELRSVQRAV